MAEVARRPTSQRMSFHGHAQTSRDGRPRSSESAGKKDIWSSMLDDVSSGKKLPEKQILVLGGTSEQQRDFIDGLHRDPVTGRKPPERQTNKPAPLANEFALGYTYLDVLDADHEDILTRLSLYLLSEPSSSFIPLLNPLFSPESLADMLVVVLLDWTTPWTWLRQLREWIVLLRTVLASLSPDCQEAMEENMSRWKNRGREGASGDNEFAAPLGTGEWDEPLGVPLCVVCQSADKIETLEKERGWKEEEFDFVLQYVRTVLLKHGASLIYTSTSSPNSVQTLIHSSMNIQSLLKKQQLKHNVIDRDKVLVPPNWDSWGKIRVLREGFDVEGVSNGWSADIQEPLPQQRRVDEGEKEVQKTHEYPESSAVSSYEEVVRNPRQDRGSVTSAMDQENQTMDTQSFLASQLEVMEKLKQEEQSQSGKDAPSQDGVRGRLGRAAEPGKDATTTEDRGRVHEHIGPVQFNMGGIQVDADDMLKRLKDRQADRSPGKEASATSPDGKPENEALASFFAGLMKRGGGSQTSSPRS